MMQSALNKMLARGLDANLALKAINNGYTVSKLGAARKEELARIFSDDEASKLKESVTRKPISDEVLARLAVDCEWKCCLCWDISLNNSVIVHHLEEHSKTRDDSYDNLVVLCLNHHAVAHSRWEISRPPWPPDLIRLRKLDFAKAIKEFKAGLRLPPGSEARYSLARPVGPSPPTPFIGRKDSLEQIARAFCKELPARVALYGMGGSGKSALARQAAQELSDCFPGGVLWTGMAEYNGSSQRIMREWLTLCSKPMPPAESLTNTVRAALAEYLSVKGPFLVVLDDVREAWEDEARVVLASIPAGASVLTTMRHATLASSFSSCLIPVDGMNPEEAIQFLSHSAARDFANSDCDIAFELLRSLGHLPLAIELAGKTILFRGDKPGFSLVEFQRLIAVKADEHLSLPGHPGLAAAFSISFEALDATLQCLYVSLGAFSNSEMDLYAVAFVVNVDHAEAERGLDHLVAASMLRWGTLQNRYALHPLLWQYADTLLLATETFSLTIARHLEYYQELCKRHAKNSTVDHDELHAILPNILTAVSAAEKLGKLGAVDAIARSLSVDSEFLSTRSEYACARTILEKAIDACRSQADKASEEMHLTSLGTVYSILGMPLKARQCMIRAIEISRSLGLRNDEAAQLGNLGTFYQTAGDIENALGAYNEALCIAEEVHDATIMLDVMSHIGGLFRRIGDIQTARLYYEKVLKTSRALHRKLVEGNCLCNLALTYEDEHRLDIAEGLIKQALEIAVDIGDKSGEANRNGHLGNIYCKQADQLTASSSGDQYIGLVERGLDHLRKAYQVSRDIGHRSLEAAWLGNMGNALTKLSRWDESIICYSNAVAISREIDQPETEGIFLSNLGQIYWYEGDVERASKLLQQAGQILHKIGSRQADQVDNILRRLKADRTD